jgi:hypothetical protein
MSYCINRAVSISSDPFAPAPPISAGKVGERMPHSIS